MYAIYLLIYWFIFNVSSMPNVGFELTTLKLSHILYQLSQAGTPLLCFLVLQIQYPTWNPSPEASETYLPSFLFCCKQTLALERKTKETAPDIISTVVCNPGSKLTLIRSSKDSNCGFIVDPDLWKFWKVQFISKQEKNSQHL